MNIIACSRRAVEKLITTAAAKEKEQDLSKAVIDGPTNGRADWFRRGFPEHRVGGKAWTLFQAPLLTIFHVKQSLRALSRFTVCIVMRNDDHNLINWLPSGVLLTG
ncbi:hypothetical protein T02_14438 [Trichinella nativa]|uniref:Uncharacterized protein n=1 Tax=Trichinella nativa TaxID=6335 RepID=A0A0V1LUV3_9BILA|nr:hypothetical protein T06_4650 [Trichinella sp. T6]KRZ63243.1 hypothetical protein T02_14438 [Trichinella nativa]